jgi:EmrB/QacA subfamily drug resistance transporter
MSACVVVVVAMVASINLALPKLSASALRLSSTELLWIVDGYILVFGCLLIPAGAIADRYGRKGILTAGLGLFAAGCFVSAAANGFLVLLAGRVLSGGGAALVMPATLSLLLQVTPPHRKAHAVAGWSAATGAAGAFGNLGGGLILQWFPWQGLFLVVGPLAVVLAVAVERIAPRGDRREANIDPVGTALLTGAVLALLFGIIEGPERGWGSALVVASFATAVGLLAGFARRGLRSSSPLLDPRVFRIPKVRTGAIGVAAVFFGLFALFFVNSQYLQYAKGFSALQTGVAILPLPLAMVVVSRRSVGIAQRVGVRTVVTAGLLLLAVGLAAMSFMTASTPYLPYASVLVTMAVGMGLAVPALSTGIVTSLPSAQAGTGSGLNSAVREIGAALGIAVIGTILSSQFGKRLPVQLRTHAGSPAAAIRGARVLGPDVHAHVVTAFTDAMAIGFRVIAVAVALSALLVRPNDDPAA